MRAAPAILCPLAAAALLAAGPSPDPSPRSARSGETSGAEAGARRLDHDDDFLRAFAAARARGALVLVDVWAPW